MSGVRVLVGTVKGVFVLTSDGTRKKWDVSAPNFGGWQVYHAKGSPADPDRLYASQQTDWFGQIIQRSNDGGKTWEQVGNKFEYDGPTGDHLWYDGSSKPWAFKRVWHIEPSLDDPDVAYAGVEDAAMFRTTDGGKTWHEMNGLRTISSAGAFRTDDGGKTWKPINKGLKSEYIPDPDAEVGHCVHRIGMHPSRPNVLFMQKHWDVLRSDDAGESWHEVSGNLPIDFGFTIGVNAHEPETVYVVPIKSDSEHFVLDGKLRVFRSKTAARPVR
jgi:photosystem II stability/assembly factor-like uncharacterized protein